jgi:hypothetical protein
VLFDVWFVSGYRCSFDLLLFSLLDVFHILCSVFIAVVGLLKNIAQTKVIHLYLDVKVCSICNMSNSTYFHVKSWKLWPRLNSSTA